MKPIKSSNGDIVYEPQFSDASMIWLHGSGDTAEKTFQFISNMTNIIEDV